MTFAKNAKPLCALSEKRRKRTVASDDENARYLVCCWFARVPTLPPGQLFQSNAVSSIGFVEEALPFTDVLPTATLAWVVENFFSDTGVGKLLGLEPKVPPPAEDADK